MRRALATSAGKGAFHVFDRGAKRLQRQRAALCGRDAEALRDEVALRTIERLAFITRDLGKVLDFGSHLGNFLRSLCTELTGAAPAEALAQLNADKAKVRLKIRELTMVDSSEAMLNRDAETKFSLPFGGSVRRVVTDEESFDHEVFVPDHYDAVISNLLLHWINDLPQTLANISKVLKPDGLFMATIYGGDTLYELRTLLQLAELERRGGMLPRVLPLVRLTDVGLLLNRAGFSMLTIDPEDIVVGGFPDIVSVCGHLQLMGEQNALAARAGLLPRDVLLAANEIYKLLHGEEQDGTVTLPATFSVIFMIGWKKSADQPQPLKRGTGEISLKDVL